MTILDFIQLTSKEITSYFLSHGIKSRYDFLKKSDDTIKFFCKLLSLEKDNCKYISICNNGSYTAINFQFELDCQKNVDWKSCTYSSYDDDFILYIQGTTEKTLKARSVMPDINYHIWAQKLYFLIPEMKECNFQYKIKIDNISVSVSEALKIINDKAEALIPHIEYYLNTLKDGTYKDAYNKINLNNIDIEFELKQSSLYINTHYNVYKICHYDMNILETMLLLKYMPNIYSWFLYNKVEDELAELDIKAVLKEAADIFILSQDTKNKIDLLNNANKEFIDSINSVVDTLSKKYSIDKSYFTGYQFCEINIPGKITNLLDLTKPYEK